MKRRIEALCLCLCLCLGMLYPQNVSAGVTERSTVKQASSSEKDTDGNGITDNGYSYTVNKTTNTATITGYTATVTALTVPGTIDVAGGGNIGTYAVTEIGVCAFTGKGGFTSVVLPEGILTIGERAFYGCMSVTKITIPKSTIYIGAQAFSDCAALSSFTVTAGNNYYTVIENCLYQFTRGNDGLYGYTLLQYPIGSGGTSFTAPSTTAMTGRLIGIGAGAFMACTTMKTVTLPDTVTTIEGSAFQGCTAITEMNMPTSLTKIGNYAFSGVAGLKKAALPDTLTSIGSNAFENCISLAEVTLPDTLSYLGSSAFQNCISLKEIKVPSALTYLTSYIWKGCTNLSKVWVPRTVKNMGTGAFDGCLGLTVYAHNDSEAVKYAQSHNIPVIYTYTVCFYNGNLLISTQEVEPGGAAIPPTLTSKPGYELFWSGSYENILADKTLYSVFKKVYTVIFKDDYNGYTENVSVPVGSAAKAPDWTMKNYTLKWDKDFSNVTDNMVVNASWVNNSNGFIVTGTTPKPEKYGSVITSSTKTYKVVNSDPSTPKLQLTGTTNGEATGLTVPDKVTSNGVSYSVTSVGSKAFADNVNLKSIYLGGRITKIGTGAFQGCTSLSSIKIKSTKLTSVGSSAFKGIYSKAVVRVPSSKMTKYKKMLRKSGMGSKVVFRSL